MKSSDSNSNHHHHLAFSSTDFFFVSTNLARRCIEVPESAIVLAYSDQHPTIRRLNASTCVDLDSSVSSTGRDSNSYEYILLTVGGVATVLLHALSVALVGVGRLPEFFQVTPLHHILTITITNTYHHHYCYHHYHC